MVTSKSSLSLSLGIHGGVLLLMLTMATVQQLPSPASLRRRAAGIIDITPYRLPLLGRSEPGPAGGSGGSAATPVSFGRLPKPSPRPFIAPAIRETDHTPPLLVEPSILAGANAMLPQVDSAQWGDPLSRFRVLSDGTGLGPGMGDGKGTGVGPNHGPGYGPGGGDGPGGFARPVAGATAPIVLYKLEPEYSEEARKAKHHGMVVLVVDVDASGRARNVRVARSLGLGLDEKAVEAVSHWRFRPAIKDGKPVSVQATIEVNFRLL